MRGVPRTSYLLVIVLWLEEEGKKETKTTMAAARRGWEYGMAGPGYVMKGGENRDDGKYSTA